jgi:hypothetical protein
MTQPTCPTSTRPQRRWLDPRVLGVGSDSGLLGGLCCITGAIAVGSGLAGLSAAGRLMDRYQPYLWLKVGEGSIAIQLVHDYLGEH